MFTWVGHEKRLIIFGRWVSEHLFFSQLLKLRLKFAAYYVTLVNIFEGMGNKKN